MAKLTVFFKYKAIDSYLFEKGVVHIGRDETNDLTIDSLAVAPAHAAIINRGNVSSIKQLNENFPLIVNGQKVKECELNHNDTITIGKHDIVYSVTESADPEAAHPKDENFDYSKTPATFDMEEEATLPPANLQVLNGINIGKVLPIKKSMTRLGNAGSGVVVISKRKDAYYISALENKGTLKVNDLPFADSNIKLNNNDVIVINGTSLQFFLS
ncbi:MAG: FHA domain-containing protein [Methylovulum miyakonense]|uniref:FHA domain-containing protein n=1 Tax=Methylovulum miyakonense TaxID=645578 RepID=UPI003BB5082E